MDSTYEYYTVLYNRLREAHPLVQILAGPRQVGKSTVARKILDTWPPNLGHFATADSAVPLSHSWLESQWEQAARLGPGALLIVDEVQKVQGWSEVIKARFDAIRGKGTLKILLLGSSSLNLKKGAGESLAGRFELTEAKHWSWAAFQNAFGWDFEKYLRRGAYPGAAEFASDEDRWQSYIQNSIVEPVLSRDILGQVVVSKPALFRQTFELAVRHPAHVVSLTKLLGQLQDSGNVTTIRGYLDMLQEAYLIRLLDRYSGSILKSRGSIPKIIVLNPALTHAFVSPARLDADPVWRGHMVESVMGAAFLREKNTRVSYWREGNDEVDFVLQTRDGKLRAIEIKSGPRLKGKGLDRFKRKFPQAECEIWNMERCLAYLKTERAS